MSTPAAELHPCECGCGEMVRNRFARGHHLRNRPKTPRAAPRLAPLPGPDVPDDELDMGLLEPDEFAEAPPPRPGPEPREFVPGDETEEIEQDRPPGHLSAPAAARERGSQRRTRVTAAVRKDITAKIRMPLFVGGKIWQARDPWCGTVFVQQADDIADALTDIVCDSADLVAFFTGPAGGFMKYLNLASALAPVAQVAWAHHVAHSVGGEEPQAPDMRAYAA